MLIQQVQGSPSRQMAEVKVGGAQGTLQRCIMLLDDHPLRCAAYELLLGCWAQKENHQLCTAAGPGEGFTAKPDLAVTCTGNAGAARITEIVAALCSDIGSVPVVVLSDRDGAIEVAAAFRAGARGYVTTRTEPQLLFGALSFILNGGMYFPPSAVLERLTEIDMRNADFVADGAALEEAEQPEGETRLTPRQQAVLRLLRQGQSNKRIGRELHMCESTVKVHVRQILRRLGAANRTQAAIRAGVMQAKGGAPGGEEIAPSGMR